VEGRELGRISQGLLVFLAVAKEDSSEDLDFILRKVPALRVFPDGEGKMNRSVKEAGGQLLVVSQFTLVADTKQGNRPGFSQAAQPEDANRMVTRAVLAWRNEGILVETGEFGADMQVHLINDGPATFWLDSRA
jgi:D-aminoacyl-tRNA deacylase